MEATVVYWDIYRDNGKEHGNSYSIPLGFHSPLVILLLRAGETNPAAGTGLRV